ncbi:hypothetical protein VP01_3434g1 [Puccinia sorghi]|uniref:Uncharacterized protein n=1 Tax=Puccinia sorghi TaxID=27349 RepID=A0A0L6UWC3_9BASI|nr:hypothetical protein VP01_3434g1 [Puccinia sorghi]
MGLNNNITNPHNVTKHMTRYILLNSSRVPYTHLKSSIISSQRPLKSLKRVSLSPSWSFPQLIPALSFPSTCHQLFKPVSSHPRQKLPYYQPLHTATRKETVNIIRFSPVPSAPSHPQLPPLPLPLSSCTPKSLLISTPCITTPIQLPLSPPHSSGPPLCNLQNPWLSAGPFFPCPKQLSSAQSSSNTRSIPQNQTRPPFYTHSQKDNLLSTKISEDNFICCLWPTQLSTCTMPSAAEASETCCHPFAYKIPTSSLILNPVPSDSLLSFPSLNKTFPTSASLTTLPPPQLTMLPAECVCCWRLRQQSRPVRCSKPHPGAACTECSCTILRCSFLPSGAQPGPLCGSHPSNSSRRGCSGSKPAKQTPLSCPTPSPSPLTLPLQLPPPRDPTATPPDLLAPNHRPGLDDSKTRTPKLFFRCQMESGATWNLTNSRGPRPANSLCDKPPSHVPNSFSYAPTPAPTPSLPTPLSKTPSTPPPAPVPSPTPVAPDAGPSPPPPPSSPSLHPNFLLSSVHLGFPHPHPLAFKCGIPESDLNSFLDHHQRTLVDILQWSHTIPGDVFREIIGNFHWSTVVTFPSLSGLCLKRKNFYMPLLPAQLRHQK